MTNSASLQFGFWTQPTLSEHLHQIGFSLEQKRQRCVVRTYVAISTAQELHHPRVYVRTYVRKRMAVDSQILCSKSCVPHPESQDDALSILGHLRAGDVQVHGRWFTDGRRDFQDVNKIS